MQSKEKIFVDERILKNIQNTVTEKNEFDFVKTDKCHQCSTLIHIRTNNKTACISNLKPYNEMFHNAQLTIENKN